MQWMMMVALRGRIYRAAWGNLRADRPRCCAPGRKERVVRSLSAVGWCWSRRLVRRQVQWDRDGSGVQATIGGEDGHVPGEYNVVQYRTTKAHRPDHIDPLARKRVPAAIARHDRGLPRLASLAC